MEIESPVFHPIIFHFTCVLTYRFYFEDITGTPSIVKKKSLVQLDGVLLCLHPVVTEACMGEE